MLTTFVEFHWQMAKALKVYMEANLPCVNSIDIKLKYYTVVHKCFKNY